MVTSPSITKIIPAFLKAQQEIEVVKKDATNPHYNSNYATLTAVIGAVKEILNKHEISLLQPVVGDVVETILMHSSGEWFSSQTNIIMQTQSAQQQGSAITYARRYGLAAIMSLEVEDDDGEGALDKSERPIQRTPAQKPKQEVPQKPITNPNKPICLVHKTNMGMNKFGRPFHKRELPDGTLEFCNGRGYPSESVRKPVTVQEAREAMLPDAEVDKINDDIPF